MVNLRLMQVLKCAGIGVDSESVDNWLDALNLALTAGMLRLGGYNLALIRSVGMAWTSRVFKAGNSRFYTHGNAVLEVSEDTEYEYFIRLPQGHALKAEYKNREVTRVLAVTTPGVYGLDVTSVFARFFPRGVRDGVSAIYTVLSCGNEDWTKEARDIWDTFMGVRTFREGVDRLTLAWVDGMEFMEFIDEGLIGGLSRPVITPSVEGAEKGVCIGIDENNRGAVLSVRADVGEIIDVRAHSGLVTLELDSGDTVKVRDLLALRGMDEGCEVYYTYSGDEFVICDEYGNFLLGCR
jgi:hypothetical protein